MSIREWFGWSIYVILCMVIIVNLCWFIIWSCYTHFSGTHSMGKFIFLMNHDLTWIIHASPHANCKSWRLWWNPCLHPPRQYTYNATHESLFKSYISTDHHAGMLACPLMMAQEPSIEILKFAAASNKDDTEDGQHGSRCPVLSALARANPKQPEP